MVSFNLKLNQSFVRMIIIYNEIRKKCTHLDIEKKFGGVNLASTSLDSAMEVVKVTLMNVGVRYTTYRMDFPRMCVALAASLLPRGSLRR